MNNNLDIVETSVNMQYNDNVIDFFLILGRGGGYTQYQQDSTVRGGALLVEEVGDVA